jgi:maleylpyruvate isomerase
MSEHFDPTPASAEIDTATARLLDTVRSMSDAEVPAPSALPGWSRGHVLAHLARNADGLVNLLTGATEGVERSAYASPDARKADIEAGSRRPVNEQLADIEAAHARFMTAVAAVPPSGWDFVLHWGAAGKTPAREVLDARLREVAIHHVDLDAGHTAAQWSPELAMRILRSVLPASEARGISRCTLVVNDTATMITVSGGSDVEVSGAAHALATWLLGRDSGGSLTVSGGELPTPPAWP